MEIGDSDRLKKVGSAPKITAAHLAGLRPRPSPISPIGKWDTSTAFVAGFGLAALFVPEMASILGEDRLAPGSPFSAIDLAILLVFVAGFGVFPVVFLHHLFFQNIVTAPSRRLRFVSTLIALAAMYASTSEMKPIVGYDQKLEANARYANSIRIETQNHRVLGDISRSPASTPAESAF
jgi:hypothetical protein